MVGRKDLRAVALLIVVTAWWLLCWSVAADRARGTEPPIPDCWLVADPPRLTDNTLAVKPAPKVQKSVVVKRTVAPQPRIIPRRVRIVEQPQYWVPDGGCVTGSCTIGGG